MIAENDKAASLDKGSGTAACLATIIFFVAFCAYVNTLHNGFVWDDAVQILKNPWITHLRNLRHVFATNVGAFMGITQTNYYRPLMHAVYMLEYSLFGFKPWGYHLVNVLFHAGVSVMVFFLTARLIRQQHALSSLSAVIYPFVAALLFAIHPVHTEPVAWVACIPELTFAFFYLLSLYFYLLHGDRMGWAYAVSVLSFFIATLCKESAVTLPFVLMLHDFTFRRKTVCFPRLLTRYVPYLLVVAIYLVLRFNALGGMTQINKHGDLTTYQAAINTFPLLLRYFYTLVLPIDLNAFYVFHPIRSLHEGAGLPSLLFVVFLALLALVTAVRNRLAFFGLLFTILTLLPVLYIPALGENPFCERYLYLPSVGFILLAISFFAHREVTGWRFPFVLLGAVSVVACLYVYGTVSRNFIWRSDSTLWADTVKKSPDDVVPHQNLAVALRDVGDADGALKHFEMAYALKPNEETSYNLGLAFKKKGLLDQAIAQYQKTLAFNPNNPETINNLGNALLEKGSIDDAIAQYRRSVALTPQYPLGHMNLGIAYLKKGLLDQAIEQLSRFVELQPGSLKGHVVLGMAYRNKGLMDKASEQFALAREIDPRFSP